MQGRRRGDREGPAGEVGGRRERRGRGGRLALVGSPGSAGWGAPKSLTTTETEVRLVPRPQTARHEAGVTLKPAPPHTHTQREDTGSETRSGQPKATQLESGRGLNRVSLACPHHATWCRRQGARGLGADQLCTWQRAEATGLSSQGTGKRPARRPRVCRRISSRTAPSEKTPAPRAKAGTFLLQSLFIGGRTEARESVSDQNLRLDHRSGRCFPARWLSP